MKLMITINLRFIVKKLGNEEFSADNFLLKKKKKNSSTLLNSIVKDLSIT